MILGEHMKVDSPLVEVGQAIGGKRLALGLGQGRQKEARQDGDDGDHHEQLDEGEGTATVRFHFIVL